MVFFPSGTIAVNLARLGPRGNMLDIFSEKCRLVLNDMLLPFLQFFLYFKNHLTSVGLVI